MLTFLAAFILRQQDVVAFSRTFLPNPFGARPRLLIQFDPENKASQPKMSPKKFGVDKIPFEFDFFTGGYVAVNPTSGQLPCRFRVYEQQRKQKNDVAYAVTQMLLRLWEYNFNHLKLDHSLNYNQRMVDVYLCWGGTPGGEQLFDIDKDLAVGGAVNTIYIYDLPSFTKPIEMAREVAHEYGHASLPAIGGFKTPEDWGNGYLGERLFLTYLRNELVKGELAPQDAMGASAEDLDHWVKENVDPLVIKAATLGPNEALLGGTGQESMNAYMGLMLYASQLLPEGVFQRGILQVGSESAKDIPGAFVSAVEEPDEVILTVPASLAGRSIWVPVSKARILGATVTAAKNGWALIKPVGKTVTLKNQPASVR